MTSLLNAYQMMTLFALSPFLLVIIAKVTDVIYTKIKRSHDAPTSHERKGQRIA